MQINTVYPVIRPFLKWAGGKRQLLPEIKKHLPHDMAHYTYYEPFIGAGAVFFELQPKTAVINDCNEQLILSYIAVKEDAEKLILLLKEHEEKNNKEYYYKIRNMDRDDVQFNALSNIQKAARLIYLNKSGKQLNFIALFSV